MKKWSVIRVVSAVALLVIGLTALFVLPLLIVRVIHSRLYLSPDNPSYGLWRDLPVPIHSKFYMFNVTNADEVQTSGAKPKLQQVGPFVYRMSMTKTANISDGGDRVEFVETISYYFDELSSVADDNVVVTTLNAPLAIAFGLIESLPIPAKIASLLAIAALREPFFVRKSVRELLFDGYPDILIALAPIFNPKIPHWTRFAYMYGKNDSGDGLFRVNSGKQKLSLTNTIESLDGRPELPYWTGECNSFKGATNGELFSPLDADQPELFFFRTNFCRTWTMVFESFRRLGDDFAKLSVYRYRPANNTFANATEYPPNSCFTPSSVDKTAENAFIDTDRLVKQINQTVRKYLNDAETANNFSAIYSNLYTSYLSNRTRIEAELRSTETVNRQFPSGIFPMSGCQYSAPLYLSYAHFLNADPVYLERVDGLRPNASLHETYLDVEPITGTSVEFVARLQLNAFVNPFILYPKMPKIIFPVFWQDLNLELSPELANQLKWSLTVPSMIATIISLVFVGAGTALLLFSVSRPLWRRLKPNASDCTAAKRDQSGDSGEEDRQQLINGECNIEDSETAQAADNNNSK